MVLIPVCCPHCGSDQVIKGGTTAAGKQRHRCQNEVCSHQTFIRDYSYRAYLPEVKQEMIDMAVNDSGFRDTDRLLGVGKNTVVRALKEKNLSSNFVNTALLKVLNPEAVIVEIHRIDEAEVDEMGSFVGHKKDQRWL